MKYDNTQIRKHADTTSELRREKPCWQVAKLGKKGAGHGNSCLNVSCHAPRRRPRGRVAIAKVAAHLIFRIILAIIKMKIRNEPKASGTELPVEASAKGSQTDSQTDRQTDREMGGRSGGWGSKLPLPLGCLLGLEKFAFWWRLIKRDKCQDKCESGVAWRGCKMGRDQRNY